ncbi:MAG TPA: nitroreductase family protein, partial [Proteiniclasticum sp.]|nr:nitroreductase family protein [Proteiniclasticum sp.]
RSIRDFKSDKIEESIINEIIVAAQSMPNSINGQQTSIVVVQDVRTKAAIAEYAGGQPWIDKAPLFLLFVTDFYKTNLAAKKNGLTQKIHASVESTVVGAVDVGLNMGAAIIAAESLGLGIVPIGGIRNTPQEIIDLLSLPEMTFPVAGLAIGYPNSESRKKPRLPLNTFRHDEKYKTEHLEKEIDNYDLLMADYLKEINRSQEINWSTHTSSIYKQVYFPKVHPVMTDQGFKNDK